MVNTLGVSSTDFGDVDDVINRIGVCTHCGEEFRLIISTRGVAVEGEARREDVNIPVTRGGFV